MCLLTAEAHSISSRPESPNVNAVVIGLFFAHVQPSTHIQVTVSLCKYAPSVSRQPSKDRSFTRALEYADGELIARGDSGSWGDPRGEKYLMWPMASSAKSRNSCDGSKDMLAFGTRRSERGEYGSDAGDKFQTSVLTTS